MKKNLFGWLAMAAMLVGTGCSTDEVVNDYSPENAIQFGTYVGRDAQSRVAETDLREVKKDGFGVFANYTNGGTGLIPNFMNNQSVTWNDGENVWKYSPIKYWPNTKDAKVSFWAYSPYCATDWDKDASAPFFTISDGTDYVVAHTTSQKQGVNDNIKFTFGHIMSKVGFKVEAIIDEIENEEGDSKTPVNGNPDENSDLTNNDIPSETNIVVTDVQLVGKLDKTGTMTGTNNGWEMEVDNNTDEDITYTLNHTNFENTGYHACGYNATNNEYTYLPGQLATKDKAQLNNDDSYFMFLPQTADFTITIKYNVITGDAGLATKYSNVQNTVVAEVKSFPFESGNAYNFVLQLGLTAVKLSAEVDGWGTASDRYVNVPLNEATTVTPAP